MRTPGPPGEARCSGESGAEMRALQTAFYAGLVVFAAALAAVLAHVVIDVAGDYLLAHDTYDGVAHHSRGLFLGIALGVLALALLRYLFELFDRRSSSMVSLLRCLRAAQGAHLLGFVAWVCAATPLALVGMEAYDLLADFGHVASVRALLGGSVALGLSSALAAAIVVAMLAQWLFRLLANWEPAIASLVARLVCARRHALPVRRRRLLSSLSLDAGTRPARRRGKRAPPLATPA